MLPPNYSCGMKGFKYFIQPAHFLWYNCYSPPNCPIDVTTHSKHTMINYLVKCPSDPYENTDCFNDLDHAYDLCYNLSEEYGYAEIGYYNVQGHYQLVILRKLIMWEEIQDSPGEIYDMEDFYKQVEELREIMDKCIELEEQQ